jgi:hypothetical protein
MSGIALQTKLAPLISRAKQRQEPFSKYENDLAKRVVLAAGNYYGIPALADASSSLAITCVWPEPSFPDPSPERDGSDDWELERGVKSLIDVVAERRGVTREKALELIKQVSDDNEDLAEFFPKGVPSAPSAQPDPEPGEEPESQPTNPPEGESADG